MRGKRLLTGFFEGFVKPTVSMTATVTAATGVGLALHTVANTTYEYATGKINQYDLDKYSDNMPPYNNTI